MSVPNVRERLAEAAFALFREQGYDATTIDDITSRAGLGRTTFFRAYRSKDDVIFPDHDRLLDEVAQRLSASSTGTALAAVTDAVRLVLQHYLREGDRARQRYELTRTVPILREREVISVQRYQRLFRRFIADSIGTDHESPLRAELMASAVVAAHNQVLRRWLRRELGDPLGAIDTAMAEVTHYFGPHHAAGDRGTRVVVLETDAPWEQVASVVQEALQADR